MCLGNKGRRIEQQSCLEVTLATQGIGKFFLEVTFGFSSDHHFYIVEIELAPLHDTFDVDRLFGFILCMNL